MRLHKIPASAYRRIPRKRLGRGESSGHGKTAGRGQKGQLSRSGTGMRPMFESGHVPLYRRLPRRGFNNKRFATVYETVNVGDVDKLPQAELVDRAMLVKHGLVRNNANPLKILGDGEVEHILNVEADKFSATAKEKIEKAGGKAIEVAATRAEVEAETEGETPESEA